jgi:YD repeat-containing protein
MRAFCGQLAEFWGVSMKNLIAIAIVLVALLSMRADSAETVTYKYDAKGRLVKVVRTGNVNNNVQTDYTYDKVNNRKTTTTTGSNNSVPAN